MTRVKQTARKSTAASNTGPSTSGHNSSNHSLKQEKDDPLRQRMDRLLTTKRKSATPQQQTRFPLSIRGKRVPDYDVPSGSGVKKRPRARQGEIALREIRSLQNQTNLLIPKAPFHRLVRQITQEYSSGEIKYQTAALLALQEATENFLINLMGDAYLCSIHAKRVTLMVSDMQLARRLQRDLYKF